MITKIARFVKVENPKDADGVFQVGNKKFYFKIVVEEGEQK
jgi:hypothetical protein